MSAVLKLPTEPALKQRRSNIRPSAHGGLPMTRRRQPQRMTAADVRRACDNLGIGLATDTGSQRLYLWSNTLSVAEIQTRLTEKLFDAIILNQSALLRQVRLMDDSTLIAVAASPLPAAHAAGVTGATINAARNAGAWNLSKRA